MANEFLFNPAQVDGVANKLNQRASQLESAQKELKTTIEKVSSWWEGESQAAYIQQYKNFEPSLSELSKLARQISKQLKEIAQIKKENEARRANMFK